MRCASTIAVRQRSSTAPAPSKPTFDAVSPALDGELIAPDDRSIRVVAALKPFSVETIERRVGAGHSLLELVALTEPPLHLARFIHVAIGDLYVPRDNWHRVRPKPGTTVTIRVVPGIGGGGKKNPLAFILTLLVMVAATIVSAGALAPLFGAAFAAGTIGAAVAGAAVSLVGTLIIRALIPPAKPRLNDLNGQPSSSPTLSIQGTRNQARPWGKVPRQFGKHRIRPDYGAKPYTEIRGADQYIHVLFDCGYGPLEFSDFRIGQTPLANFDGVEMEVRQGFPDDPPLTLVTGRVDEQGFQILVDVPSDWIVRNTKPLTDRISIDFTFPSGVAQFDDSGGRHSWTVELAAEYRSMGAVDWISIVAPVALGSRSTAALKRPKGNSGGAGLSDHGSGPGGRNSLQRMTYRISLDPDTGAISIVSGAATIAIPTRNIAVAGVLLDADAAVPGALTDERSAATIAAGYFAPVLNGDLTVTIGAGQVSPAPLRITDNSTSAVRANRPWAVPRGEYEVRVKRVTPDATDDDKTFDKVFWTALRSFNNDPPITEAGHTQIGMVIKATNQLNGIVDELNCIAQSILWDFDGTAWSQQPSSNPAAAYVEMLRGRANKRPARDSRIDWPAMEAWAVASRAAGREFDAVIDFGTTVFEALKLPAAAGRASFDMNGHLYSILLDEPQTVPVQHFTPRNSWGFRWHKPFVEIPHGLKVRFVNRDADWMPDERIVYADGYDATNATEFETLSLFGVTNPDQIWKDARYNQAAVVLRPEDLLLNSDVEHIVARRGKLVSVQHDVILVGLTSGRIKVATLDGGGSCTGITVDEACAMEGGKSYGVAIRTVNNIKVTAPVTLNIGAQTVLAFSTPIAPNLRPDAGDLFSFGELGKETGDYIVKSVAPFDDLAAVLSLVDAAPLIYLADQGPIPAYDPNITIPIPPNGRPPARPAVLAIRSDEDVLLEHSDGALESRILITLTAVSGTGEPADRIECQFRRADGVGGWTKTAPLPGDATEFSIVPVQDKVAYEVWLRSVSRRESPSDWLRLEPHTVIGKSTPPPDVVSFLLEPAGAVWGYPNPPRDFDGFELKSNAGNDKRWETAQPLHDGGLIRRTDFPIDRAGQGLRTILIKAVDVAGNRSANAAALLIGLGDAIADNLVATVDYQALGYPGVVTDGALIGGRLRANDNGQLFWKVQDAAPFWNADPLLPFWNVDYKQMRYVATVTPQAIDVPANLKLVADVIASAFQIEYRPLGSQGPFWFDDEAPFWQADAALFWEAAAGFMPWPGQIPVTRQSYELRVTTAPSATQGQLSAFQALIDMPDIEENLDDVAIAAIGTRLPIVKQYRKIVNVNLTLQSDGGTAATARIMDKLAAGPLVQCFDGANPPVATTGLIDATVQGY